jgi:hypothetical protein
MSIRNLFVNTHIYFGGKKMKRIYFNEDAMKRICKKGIMTCFDTIGDERYYMVKENPDNNLLVYDNNTKAEKKLRRLAKKRFVIREIDFDDYLYTYAVTFYIYRNKQEALLDGWNHLKREKCGCYWGHRCVVIDSWKLKDDRQENKESAEEEGGAA